MFGHHAHMSGGYTIPVIKSDITIVKKVGGGQHTMSTFFGEIDGDIITAINNVFEGDRDIDHADIEVYTKEEPWEDDEYYAYMGWGLC